jgi:hypothetical protein
VSALWRRKQGLGQILSVLRHLVRRILRTTTTANAGRYHYLPDLPARQQTIGQVLRQVRRVDACRGCCASRRVSCDRTFTGPGIDTAACT